jgi:uridine kinase
VEIDNSLNKGVYTEVKLPYAVKEQRVREISDRMQQLIDADIPLKKFVMSHSEAVTYFLKNGMTKKSELLEQNPCETDVICYELDGYCNSFYESW